MKITEAGDTCSVFTPMLAVLPPLGRQGDGFPPPKNPVFPAEEVASQL